MRKLLLTLCISALASAFTAQARMHELQQFEVDSISTALATLWKEPMQSHTQSMTPAQKASFKKGVTLALDSARTNDPYVQGLEEGARIYRYVEQAEQIGGYTVDMDVFRKTILKAIDRKSTGFTESEADTYLTDLNTRMVKGSGKISKSEIKKASQALATVWAGYMARKSAKDEPQIVAAYRQGVTTALSYARTDDAFLDGIEAGVAAYRSFERQQQAGGYELSIVRFNLAMDKMLNGRPTGFTPLTATQYLKAMQEQLADIDALLDNSQAFLDSIARREGIINLPTGTMVEIVTEGEGDSPRAEDLVMVNYSGSLIDGTQFSGTEPGKPTIFDMRELIAGFRDGLMQMKKGGIYRIYIPSDQGYGHEGVYGKIPKDAVTIFDVELVDLRHTDELQQPAATPTAGE
ncbi:MAG: FKBP-type peptidyl-prolyl cis-trans isomerase [Paramuribaculum sp.]|nr:FKBP-type peptidyl-prolyl cis-trans isomerase [Paramuribaculum sp.]